MMTMVLLLQIHYGLRILMWIFRVAIVVFILIPGSIPALIVTALTYAISIFDPNMKIQSELIYLYNKYIQGLPLWFQYLTATALITLFLYIYIKIELRRSKSSFFIEAVKKRLVRVYEKYLKFPRFEFEQLNFEK